MQAIEIPVILPHELIHFLFLNHTVDFFSRFVGDTGLNGFEAYWHRARGQSWLREHPGAHLVEQKPRRCIPLRLHGDEAPVTKGFGMLFINFCGVMLRDMPSDLSRHLICALRELLLSFDTVWQIIAWSLQVLLDGKMPAKDWQGNDLEGERGAMAGSEIAGGFVFLVTQVVGDWKWYAETFGMGHNFYNSFNFCWLCGADKSAGHHSGFDYRDDAGWTETLVDNQTFMRDREGLFSCAWPGFHILILMLDIMHIVCLGTLHVDIGSCIWDMIQEGVWAEAGDPTTWKERSNLQLERAYLIFCQWAKTHKMEHKDTQWNLAKISMTAQTNCRPYWKGKAAANLAVSRWLKHVTEQVMQQHPGNARACHRANFFWGLVSAIDLLQSTPKFVSDEHAMFLQTCRRATLHSHRALQHFAGTSLLWQPLPKHHMLDHCLRQASDLTNFYRFNPCWCWCFTDEDFVGCLAVIARSVGHQYRERRTLERWLLKLALTLQECQ